jgi:hypothetical protein
MIAMLFEVKVTACASLSIEKSGAYILKNVQVDAVPRQRIPDFFLCGGHIFHF